MGWFMFPGWLTVLGLCDCLASASCCMWWVGVYIVSIKGVTPMRSAVKPEIAGLLSSCSYLWADSSCSSLLNRRDRREYRHWKGRYSSEPSESRLVTFAACLDHDIRCNTMDDDSALIYRETKQFERGFLLRTSLVSVMTCIWELMCVRECRGKEPVRKRVCRLLWFGIRGAQLIAWTWWS